MAYEQMKVLQSLNNTLYLVTGLFDSVISSDRSSMIMRFILFFSDISPGDLSLNFAAAGKRSRHTQSNIQISFQTRPSSITVIKNILDCYQKEERSAIHSKVTSQVTFKMMLEHAKIDTRLKSLVCKL